MARKRTPQPTPAAPAKARRGEHPLIAELAKLVGADVVISKGGDYSRLIVNGKTLAWLSGRGDYVRADHLMLAVASAPAAARKGVAEKAGALRIDGKNVEAAATWLRWAGEQPKPPRNKP